jgi:hypothetical protein
MTHSTSLPCRGPGKEASAYQGRPDARAHEVGHYGHHASAEPRSVDRGRALASMRLILRGTHGTARFHGREPEDVADPGDRGVRRPMRPPGRAPRPTSRAAPAEGAPTGCRPGRPADGRGVRERIGRAPRRGRTGGARCHPGRREGPPGSGLATATAELAALVAFTAAEEAFAAVGYHNEGFVVAARNDHDKLLRLRPGRYALPPSKQAASRTPPTSRCGGGTRPIRPRGEVNMR